MNKTETLAAAPSEAPPSPAIQEPQTPPPTTSPLETLSIDAPEPAPSLEPAEAASAVEPEPASVEEPEPALAAEPAPAEEPEPAVAEEPEPARVEEPEPVVAAEPGPVPVEEPEPAVAEEPAQVEEPKPAVAAAPEPAPVEEPEPAVAEEPEPAPAEKAEPALASEPEPAPIEEAKIPAPADTPEMDSPEPVPAAATPAPQETVAAGHGETVQESEPAAAKETETAMLVPDTPSPDTAPPDAVSPKESPEPSPIHGVRSLKWEDSLSLAAQGALLARLPLGDLPAGKDFNISDAIQNKITALAHDIIQQQDALVIVEGHCPPIAPGTPAAELRQDDFAFSRALAEQVAQLLVDNGVPAKNLAVAGYGSLWPVPDSGAAPGLDVRNRVDVWLVLDPEALIIDTAFSSNRSGHVP